MPLLRRILPLSLMFMLSALFAGCSSSSNDKGLPSTPFPLTSTPSPPAPSLPACKLPRKLPYPSWVPKDLPLPDGIYQSQRLPEEAGYHRGLFVIPVSTVQFARFVLSKWPKAGWQLGRGDAEPGEVEDQFLKSPAFGAFKAQDMACSPAHSIMLLIYVPDRSKLPGASTPRGAPAPGPT